MRTLSGMLLVLALGASLTIGWAQTTTPGTTTAPAPAAPVAPTPPATPPAPMAPGTIAAPAPAATPGTPAAAAPCTTPACSTTNPVAGDVTAPPAAHVKVRIVPPAAINPPKLDLTAPLSLDQSLELAFKYAPDVRIALDQVLRARGVVNEARAGFNPKFNAQVTYTIQQPATATIPGGGSFTITPPNATMASANILLPLDISKRITYTTQVAKYQFEIQYLNMLGTSQRLIFNVKAAYYNLLRACGQEQVAAAAVSDAEVQLKDARSKYGAGVAAKFDVTRAEVNVANLNQTLIQARRAVETARSTFDRTLGIDVNTMATVQGVDVKILEPCVDVPKAIDVAYAQRPDVLAATTSILANQSNIRLQRTGLYPSLSVNSIANQSFVATGLSPNTFTWQINTTLAIPIWDGGVTAARVQQATADTLNAENTLDQTKLGVSLEVRTAALNMLEASERIKTTAQNVSLAEEALRLAQVRYSAGISPLVEVTDAQNALTLARFNYVNAEYDYATALADYQRATSTQPEIQRLQILGSEAVCLS